MKFFNNLTRIVREELNMENIVSRIRNRNSVSPSPYAYFINSNNQQYDFFSINIIVNNRTLILFYRSSDLYLQGFISGNTYHYFNGDRPDNSDVLTNPNIDNITTASLGFRGNYDSLIAHQNYGWQTIINDFMVLANPQSTPSEIQQSAIGVILATAESMRFQNVRFAIMQSEYFEISHNSETRIFFHPETREPRSWDYFHSIITNWDSETQQAIRYFQNNEGDLTGYINHNILSGAAVITIFALSISSVMQNCNLRSYNNNEVCSIEKNDICNINTYFVDKKNELYNISCNSSEIKKVNINGKVKIIKMVKENTKGDNLKDGDILVGTTEGLYLIRENGLVLKVDNIDNDENDHTEITSIKEFGNGNFFVSTNNEEVYFLNTKPVNDGHIVGERLWNAKSYNLEKEIKFYYDENENEKTIENDWGENTHSNLIYKNFNFNKISPFSYKKIEFLGSEKNFQLSRIGWGENPFYAHKPLNYFNGVETNDYIINHKTLNNDDVKLDNCKFDVQNWRRTDSLVSNVEWYIYVGLTAYEEYPNLHFLQLLSIQFAERHGGGDNGGIVTGIGNGIRLYNDDNNAY